MGSSDAADEPWARFDEVVTRLVEKPLSEVRADVGADVGKVLAVLGPISTRITGVRNDVEDLKALVPLAKAAREQLGDLQSKAQAVADGAPEVTRQLDDLVGRLDELSSRLDAVVNALGADLRGALNTQTSRIEAVDERLAESAAAMEEAVTRLGMEAREQQEAAKAVIVSQSAALAEELRLEREAARRRHHTMSVLFWWLLTAVVIAAGALGAGLALTR